VDFGGWKVDFLMGKRGFWVNDNFLSFFWFLGSSYGFLGFFVCFFVGK
jgi:hypothetical protein